MPTQDAADLQLETMLNDLEQEVAAAESTSACAFDADQQKVELGEGADARAPNLRKSRRETHRPRRFIVSHITLKRGLAMFDVDAEKAVRSELLNMIRKDVFEPALVSQLTRQEDHAIIHSSTFLKEKFRPDGTFGKLKARLVADGSMQDKEIYENLNSPTVATVSVFCMLAMAACERSLMSTVDVGSAYLNANLDSSVFMMLDTSLATGRKIPFDKEYSLSFGDYVEARDPSVKSNDAETSRTNSAIALWPTGNLTGSWKLFDFTTGETIVRSQWRILPMTEVVITTMNA